MRVALVTGSVASCAGREEIVPDVVAEVAPGAGRGDIDLPLVAALEARGVEVARPLWDDPAVDWAGFDLALVRTTWDYTTRRDEFVAWAQATAEHTRLFNPAEVLRWNTHKSYLIELEERGAPVVPTAWLGQGDEVALVEVLAARGWKRAVCKPAVGSGSDGLAVIDGDQAGEADQRHLDELLARGDVLVQPELASVRTDGELSVIVIEGEVSHAVRKVPAAGEHRVQQEWGSTYTVEALDAPTAALATWVVEAVGTSLLIARVDLLADDVGTWQVVELEATEPDLYLGLVPDAAERLADVVVARAGA